MGGFLFLVTLAALVAAVIFFLQARSNGAALLTVRRELDELKKATEADRAKVKEAEAELKSRAALLQESREKLAEARKKLSEPKGGGSKGSPKGRREAELEEDLGHARALTAEAHAAEEKARKDAQAAKAELAAAQAELKKAQEKVRELASQAAPAAAAAPAATGSAASDEAARRAEERRREAEKRAADLDGALKAAKEKELHLKDEVKKFKGRAETNNRVYIVMKGELDLTKERLAQAERRLWQAGIVLPKPEPKERPKATGPAAADRPREERPAPAAEAAPAEAPAAPDQAPPAASEAPTEPGLPVANAGPQAVEPVRRRKPEGEANGQ